MKRLTLMRHGEAQWKDPQIPDFNRSLNRRGVAEVESIARRLLELTWIPTLLLSSSAQRTQQTAQIVARELGIPARHARSDESLYLASAQDILAVTRSTGPRIPHLMVIGHNPGLLEAAQLLAPNQALRELPTAAICSMAFDTGSWSAIGPATLADVRCEAPAAGLLKMWA